MRCCIVAAALALVWAGARMPAQVEMDPIALVATLAQDPDGLPADRALRQLARLPGDRLPAAALRGLLGREATHAHALRLLGRAGLLRVEDAWSSDLADEELAQLALAPRDDAALRMLLPDVTAPAVGRRAALFLLHDRSALRPSDLAAALDDDDETLARAAAALVRWELVAVPEALLAELVQRVAARERLLELLAESPRPSLSEWALACHDDPALPGPLRVLALAAAGRPLDLEQARFALDVLAADPNAAAGAFGQAMAHLPEAVADGLVGEVHRRCELGLDPTWLWPLLERLTPLGERQLLGLVATLAPKPQAELAAFLAQRGSAGLRQRVRAALDGEIPLEPYLLPRATELLDRPERTARVAALMADPAQPAAARAYAFAALVGTGAVTRPMVAFAADDDTGARWVELLQGARQPLAAADLTAALDFAGEPPPELGGSPLQAWVERAGRVQLAALQAMERHGVPAALEPRLLELVARALRDRIAAAELRAGQAAVRALAVGGGEAAGAALWDLVRREPGLQVLALESFAAGRRPWVHALLLGELARTDGDRGLRARIRALLVELGDRRELKELLAAAPVLEARWLRRARRAMPVLATPQALLLLDALPAAGDGDAAVEMLLWAGGSPDAAVHERIAPLGDHEDPELQEAALRSLMRGPRRTAMLARLDAALAAGPLAAADEVLAYEAIGGLAIPPVAEELRRAARLYLEQPLREGDADLQRARRFPAGTAGFPMAHAIASALRGRVTPEVETAFAAVAEAVAAHPDVWLLARQRLVCLWHAAAPDRELLQALGRATSPLLRAIPDPSDLGYGQAAWFRALRDEAAGRWQSAARNYSAAGSHLLRPGAGSGLAARVLLGDRDPARGRDPFAALAAAPFRCRAAVHLDAGRPADARAELAAARDLGHADADTRRRVESMMEQCK